MNSVEMKNVLIESTISVIGREGIEKATTNKICKKANLNEVYIYRLFGSKEKLFIDVFTQLDMEFFNSLYSNLYVLDSNELENEDKWKQYISAVWDFVFANHD